MEFIIEFPVANAVKFTRDDRNTDRRASFDQQRFADAVHMGMMERDFYQPFEQQDPLRPQFYTNFPISKLSVIDCFTGNTVASYNATIAKQFTRKYYRADAKFVSVGGKLFIYFDSGNEYSDDDFEVPTIAANHEGRLPGQLVDRVGNGSVVRYNVGGTGDQFSFVDSVIWVPELQAEGFLTDKDYAINSPVDGVVEVRYNERDADLYSVPVDLSTLEGIFVLRMEFGITTTGGNLNTVVSYSSEPIDVQEFHQKSLAIGYRHEGEFEDFDTWEYLYLSDWTNVIRVKSNFNVLTTSGEMEVYNDDFGIREQLKAVAYRELTFKAYNQPSWVVDKLNVVFGHDSILINDYWWRPADFGNTENIDDSDLNNFEINLRQKNDRRKFLSVIDVEITASFNPSSFTGIPAEGDVLVAQFISNSSSKFKFTSLPDWITADVNEFENDDYIEFTVAENLYTDGKTAILTAFSEDIAGVTAQISFEQEAGEEEPVPAPKLISVSPDVIAFAAAGEVVAVSVTADPGAQYQAISSQSWATVPNTILTGSQSINISSTQNNSGSTRNASVTFVNINDPSDTLTVTLSQAGVVQQMVLLRVVNQLSSVSVQQIYYDVNPAEITGGSVPMGIGILNARGPKGTNKDVTLYLAGMMGGTVALRVIVDNVPYACEELFGGGYYTYTVPNGANSVFFTITDTPC